MRIGTRTIETSIDLIGGLLNDYKTELHEAYLKADEALDVSLKLNISPGKNSGNKIKASISFIAEKVKDTASGQADEDQLILAFDSSKKKGLTIRPPVRVGAFPWVGCPR